jgi:hypothetical protein
MAGVNRRNQEIQEITIATKNHRQEKKCNTPKTMEDAEKRGIGEHGYRTTDFTLRPTYQSKAIPIMP